MRTTCIAATILAVLSAPQALAAACERIQRSATFDGAPLTIKLAPQAYTEVVFPEQLAGILPERPAGLRYYENAFPDRLFFTVDEKTYAGIAIVQGRSGASYHLMLDARSGCPDSTVSIQTGGSKTLAPVPQQVQETTSRKLIEYMLLGETPPAYNRESLSGPLSDRRVLQQGSVGFYLSEVYRGLNYTGFVLMAVNEGRTPYRVALEAIDFGSVGLRDKIGTVREITMQPFDFRLAPAPEFAAEATRPGHQGLVYIVTENLRRVR